MINTAQGLRITRRDGSTDLYVRVGEHFMYAGYCSKGNKLLFMKSILRVPMSVLHEKMDEYSGKHNTLDRYFFFEDELRIDRNTCKVRKLILRWDTNTGELC